MGDIETLKKNAVHFSSVKNPYLMGLDAFFAKVQVGIENWEIPLWNFGMRTFKLPKVHEIVVTVFAVVLPSWYFSF